VVMMDGVVYGQRAGGGGVGSDLILLENTSIEPFDVQSERQSLPELQSLFASLLLQYLHHKRPTQTPGTHVLIISGKSPSHLTRP